MHTIDNPFQEMRNFINEMEQFVECQAKVHNAEHLGGPQGHAIVYLSKTDRENISFKDMEEALRLSKSVTSNLLKRMEKNGFIAIVPSEKDKRVKHVILTDHGRECAGRFEDFMVYLKEVLGKGLDKEDFHAVHKVFAQLKENIRQEREKENV